MSKAEEEANKRYSITRGDDTQETSGIDMQRASDFIDGYHQAEKDNELTWEDTFGIFRLVNEVLDDYADGKTKKEVGEEVLKRFKDLKK